MKTRGSFRTLSIVWHKAKSIEYSVRIYSLTIVCSLIIVGYELLIMKAECDIQTT